MEDPLRRFFAAYSLLTYKKGELVVRAGDFTDYLYYVKSGFVRQYVTGPSGQELTVYLYPPASCLFLPWAFGVSSNNDYFETMTPATIWKAPKEEFLKFVSADMPSLIFLAGAGFVGLQVLMIHFQSMNAGDSTQKVASVLVILSKWFGRHLGRRILIDFPATHQFIASVAGISRETATIALQELRKRKVLGKHKLKITVADPEKLVAISGISLDHIPQLPRNFVR